MPTITSRAATTGVAPANVLIFISTNNLARGDCAYDIVNGMSSVIGQVKALWPGARVYFVGIPPRGLSFKRSETWMQFSLGPGHVDPDTALACHQDCGHFEDGNVHLTPVAYQALTHKIKPMVAPGG